MTNDEIMSEEEFLESIKYDYKRMDDTIHLIRDWAVQRNLIEGSTSQAQMNKMIEELGELSSVISKSNKNGMTPNITQNIAQEIGDCVVVLTILARQKGLLIEECTNIAYEKIKDRKGKMIDGIFVKEEDLNV